MFERLLLAHLVADFVLQTRWLVKKKATAVGLAVHVGLVALAMLPAAWGVLSEWWPALLLIVAAHAVIDWTKIRLAAHLRLPPIVPFLVDQALHVLVLAAAVALVGGVARPAGQSREPWWWIACLYLSATFALSIALPLWLDAPRLMHRPPAARPILIGAAALALTLAWLGWLAWIPVAGLILYEGLARRVSRDPAAGTFGVEFWTALLVAASLGWLLD